MVTVADFKRRVNFTSTSTIATVEHHHNLTSPKNSTEKNTKTNREYSTTPNYFYHGTIIMGTPPGIGFSRQFVLPLGGILLLVAGGGLGGLWIYMDC